MRAPRRSADSSHDEHDGVTIAPAGDVGTVPSDDRIPKTSVIQIVKAIARHMIMGDADSVERFAERHDISRAQAYKEIAAGRLIAREVGDRGGRTIITREDAAKWRRALPKKIIKDVPAARSRNNGTPGARLLSRRGAQTRAPQTDA